MGSIDMSKKLGQTICDLQPVNAPPTAVLFWSWLAEPLIGASFFSLMFFDSFLPHLRNLPAGSPVQGTSKLPQ